jgi:hypothetical protein
MVRIVPRIQEGNLTLEPPNTYKTKYEKYQSPKQCNTCGMRTTEYNEIRQKLHINKTESLGN